jgi:4-amino-4-deoxy-L-arabinose transferase-like glycosyltransferase
MENLDRRLARSQGFKMSLERLSLLAVGGLLLYAVLGNTCIELLRGLFGVDIAARAGWLAQGSVGLFFMAAILAAWRWLLPLQGSGRNFLAGLTWWHIALPALAIRVAWVLLADPKQSSDYAVYDRMAVDILNGKYLFDPTAIRPAGCSIVFALIYAVAGHNPLCAQLGLALVGAATVGVLHRLTLRLTQSPSAAGLAAILLALTPEHIYYSSLLGTDVLFSFLVLLGLWFLAKGDDRGSAGWVWLAAAGIFLGLGNWCRGTAPLFVFSAVLYVLLSKDRLWTRFCRGAMISAAFLVTITPILAYNWTNFHKFSPSLQQMSGWSLMVGTNVPNSGTWNIEDQELLRHLMADRGDDSNVHPVVLRDSVAMETGKRRLADNPLGFATMAMTRKLPKLWGEVGTLGWSLNDSRVADTPIWGWLKGEAQIWHACLAFAAAVGFMYAALRRRATWNVLQPFLWAMLLTTFTHVFLESQSRYHHMFLPLLCLGAAMFFRRSGLPRQDAHRDARTHRAASKQYSEATA